MEPDSIAGLLLAAGIGGIIVEVIRTLRQRKKMGAEYADVIASSAIKLLEPLEHRIEDLEEDLKEEQRVSKETKAELKACRSELRSCREELHDAREEIQRLTVLLEAHEGREEANE